MKFDLSNVQLSYNDINRNLVLPCEPTENLAEFLGILTGDGYMNHYINKNIYIIEIAGDKRFDKDYLENYIFTLIKQLFNLNPKVYCKNKENSEYIRILSKGLFSYLQIIGFKKGKKEQINVPKWILNDPNFMISFIRGVFDTDGSLMLMKKPSKKSPYYPIVALRMKSKVLVKELGYFLKNHGFIVNIIEDEIRIDKRGYANTKISSLILAGRKDLELWMSNISFKNTKHLNKYDKYIKSLVIK